MWTRYSKSLNFPVKVVTRKSLMVPTPSIAPFGHTHNGPMVKATQRLRIPFHTLARLRLKPTRHDVIQGKAVVRPGLTEGRPG